ncbi:MAG: hypothetical protein K8T20_01740 [Planctomycetes bacterium]|nr:hypothetical protein [Planctomycetota bacterium]
MSDLPGDPPAVRGGCVLGAGMRWFEKLLEAAFRHGATNIRVRAGSRFAFRIAGQTQILGKSPVRQEDLLDRLREILPPEQGDRLAGGGEMEFEFAVIPWCPARAHVFHGVRGLVLSVRLGLLEEVAGQVSFSSTGSSILGDGELRITPSVREIERILRAAFAAGASQVLVATGNPLTMRVGPEIVRVTEHSLTLEFVKDLVDSILDDAVWKSLESEGDIEFEIALPPYAPCLGSVFSVGSRPSLQVRLPGIEVERAKPLPEPSPESVRAFQAVPTVSGLVNSIRVLSEGASRTVEVIDRRKARLRRLRERLMSDHDRVSDQLIDTARHLDAAIKVRERLEAMATSAEESRDLEFLKKTLRDACLVTELLMGATSGRFHGPAIRSIEDSLTRDFRGLGAWLSTGRLASIRDLVEQLSLELTELRESLRLVSLSRPSELAVCNQLERVVDSLDVSVKKADEAIRGFAAQAGQGDGREPPDSTTRDAPPGA